jgi:hypothetical protein
VVESGAYPPNRTKGVHRRNHAPFCFSTGIE